MAKDIYQKLAKHLDNLPGGFPPSETGVELRILKKLFTPEEAELAISAGLIPEEARVIAKRAKIDPAEAETRLAELAGKGLIFSIVREGRPTLYMAAQYVIGIWEYHVNELDEELVRDMNEYIPTLFNLETWEAHPQLRTIPVEKSLEAGHEVLAYEQAREIVKGHRRYAVAPCICRKEHQLVGEGCDKLMDACLIFGWGAEYYIRNGLGREIDEAECLEIIDQADKEGLVLQPSNAQKIVNICCCCGDCCQVLKSLKRHPRPGELAATPFVAVHDPAECISCGVCVERCQMEAFELLGDDLLYKPERCIGCGLCVSTCPTDSLSLERKAEPPEPPRNMYEAGKKLARARGKLSPAKEAMIALKSKVDRLRASK